jgi:hypothetical protein
MTAAPMSVSIALSSLHPEPTGAAGWSPIKLVASELRAGGHDRQRVAGCTAVDEGRCDARWDGENGW